MDEAAHTRDCYSCTVNPSRLVRLRFRICDVLLALACLVALSPALAQGSSAEQPPPQAGTARPRIGLVLSGGGARGAAHIGVLKNARRSARTHRCDRRHEYGCGGRRPVRERLLGTRDRVDHDLGEWQEAFRDRPTRTDLTFRRKEEEENFLVNIPLGLRSGHFQLPRVSSRARS